MSDEPTTVAELVIARWGSLTACARALGKPVSTVQKWQDTGTIPLRNWPDIETQAFKEGWFDLTARWLGEAHADQEKRRSRAMRAAAAATAADPDKTTKCGVP